MQIAGSVGGNVHYPRFQSDTRTIIGLAQLKLCLKRWQRKSLNSTRNRVSRLIPLKSRILNVDFLGGLTKLMSWVLNWETVLHFRIDTSSEFHSLIQF